MPQVQGREIRIHYHHKDAKRMTPEQAYGELAYAVIVQAGRDWDALIKQELRPTKGSQISRTTTTFDSLRQFFKSEWCEILCVGMDPKKVLAELERELKKLN